MEFTLDQRFAAPPIAVAAALVDPALLATMVELPRLGEASVLTTAHTGDRVRQEVRYRFEADLPGAARRFVDPEQLTWVEVGEHDLASGQSRYLIRPDHYADLLEGRYAARVVEAGGGAARTVKGEIRPVCHVAKPPMLLNLLGQDTARLLDVKFHALHGDAVGEASSRASEQDFYHWSAILRSVSAFEIYRKVYRNVILPEKVAELLIVRPDMPRSLAHCMHEVVTNLKLVANQQSGETLRRAGRLSCDLEYARIDEILSTGLHAYLTQFLDRVGDLGAGIARDFLVACD